MILVIQLLREDRGADMPRLPSERSAITTASCFRAVAARNVSMSLRAACSNVGFVQLDAAPTFSLPTW